MGYNTTITEGSRPKRFGNTKRLVTKQSGSDSPDIPWVPKIDYLTTTKLVSKNGTYKAKDDEAYAYSKFSVNIRGAASLATPSSDLPPIPAGIPAGYDSPEVPNMDMDMYGLDPDTMEPTLYSTNGGDLTETSVAGYDKLKMKIKIPPTRYVYYVGDKIDFTGMLCGVFKDDTFYHDSRYPDGNIPFEELNFPVTVADMGTGVATVAGAIIPAMEGVKVKLYSRVEWQGRKREQIGTFTMYTATSHVYTADPDVKFVMRVNYSPTTLTNGHTVFLACSANENAKVYLTSFNSGKNYASEYSMNSSFEFGGHKVYWWKREHDGCWPGEFGDGSAYPWVNKNPYPNVADNLLAWAAVYGEITHEVPVQWMNPGAPYGASEVSEDSFKITVLERKQGATGSTGDHHNLDPYGGVTPSSGSSSGGSSGWTDTGGGFSGSDGGDF